MQSPCHIQESREYVTAAKTFLEQRFLTSCVVKYVDFIVVSAYSSRQKMDVMPSDLERLLTGI